jgi:hypothetical protein
VSGNAAPSSMAKRKGKPLSDAEKADRDRAEKALRRAKTEQVGEEAGAQYTQGDLFKKPPTPKK